MTVETSAGATSGPERRRGFRFTPVSPVVSMAILQVNADRRQVDVIEQFVPFVGECLRVDAPKVVSLPVLQRRMLEMFGLRMPQGALKTVLSRAGNQGLVTRAPGHVWVPVPERLHEVN